MEFGSSAPSTLELVFWTDEAGLALEVIQGATRLLAKLKPLLYVENDRVERSEALMRLIDGLGYELYWHVTPLFNPGNSRGVKEDIFANLASFNMFCVHRDAHASIEGLQRITDFSSHPLRKG